MTTAAELFGGGVAVITGAGSGIGAGLARYAATTLGMTVVLADVDAQAIGSLRAELGATGARADDVVCDVRDPAAVEDLAALTAERYGAVRILINNAGIEQFGYLWDTPVDNWRRLVDINISGVFYGIRSFLPRMLAEPAQSWVWNLSSVGAVSSSPMQTPYIMSKHAVLAMTECLYREVDAAGHADHVHVQAVLPGAVASSIFATAGMVDDGDTAAAERQRAEMLEIRERAMDPVAAAQVFFDASAAGEFYLLSQPFVADSMARRGRVLIERSAPQPQKYDTTVTLEGTSRS